MQLSGMHKSGVPMTKMAQSYPKKMAYGIVTALLGKVRSQWATSTHPFLTRPSEP